MAEASVTYVFSNGTSADAAQVDQNFTDLISFINGEVVQRDGSVAMTGPLVLPGLPTNALHAATKAYADNGPPSQVLVTHALPNDVAQHDTEFENWGTPTDYLFIPNPGRKVSVAAWLSGYATQTADTVAIHSAIRIGLSFDGGSTWTDEEFRISTGQLASESPILAMTSNVATPTGTVGIRAMVSQLNGITSAVHFNTGRLTALMVPSA